MVTVVCIACAIRLSVRDLLVSNQPAKIVEAGVICPRYGRFNARRFAFGAAGRGSQIITDVAILAIVIELNVRRCIGVVAKFYSIKVVVCPFDIDAFCALHQLPKHKISTFPLALPSANKCPFGETAIVVKIGERSLNSLRV